MTEEDFDPGHTNYELTNDEKEDLRKLSERYSNLDAKDKKDPKPSKKELARQEISWLNSLFERPSVEDSRLPNYTVPTSDSLDFANTEIVAGTTIDAKKEKEVRQRLEEAREMAIKRGQTARRSLPTRDSNSKF
ncbi:MAG TPA: hypothetical protein VF189_06580 [Patescibacteria group bacterium]